MEQIFYWFESSGMLDVVLPLLLIIVTVYAVLAKMEKFSKSINIVIATVMGFSTVIPHVLNTYPPCWDVVVIINNSMPKIGLFVIGLVIFLLVIMIFGLKADFFNKFIGWIVIGLFLFVTYFFLSSVETGCRIINLDILSIPLLDYIIPFVVFGLIIWLITRNSGKSDDLDLY